jgi:hypothetical protein
MSVKLFSGLGIFSDPNSATGQVSSNAVPNMPAVGNAILQVNQSLPGFLGATVPTLPSQISPQLNGAPLSITGRADIPTTINLPNIIGPVTVVPNIAPQIYSDTSAIAPFETIFQDFELEAYSFYNFWVPDEQTNDRDPLGTRQLSDVPRFIKLYWNEAPDLPDPTTQVTPKGQKTRSFVPVKFSAAVEAGRSFIIKGVIFSPDHLQPTNFPQAVESIANGYIEPGYVSSVVELPLHNAGVDYSAQAEIEPIQHLDEDAFLSSPDTQGVSLQELKAQMNQLTHGTVGVTDVAKASISAQASTDRDSLVNGKFIFSKPTAAGGFIQIHGVQSSSPALSMVVRSSAPFSEPMQTDHAVNLAQGVVQPAPVADIEQTSTNKVKFINPSIGGAISQAKVNLMTRPEHAEAMMAVAHVLPNLEVLSQANVQKQIQTIEIPSFPSPVGVKPIEYVGYVIEKYQQDDSGAYTKVDQFLLADRTYTEFIDTQILYGVTYRYRVRAVIRWTRPNNIGPLGVDPYQVLQGGSQASKLSPNLSSYFGSEWSGPWAYALIVDQQPPTWPDELTVRPDSMTKKIAVSFRLPNNPQRDIYKMRLFRKLQNEDGKDLTGWVQLAQYGSVDRMVDYGPQNVLYYDTDVDYFQSNKIRYVYAGQCISRHEEYSALTEQVGATLNQNFAIFGENPVCFVSSPGVKLQHFGAFATNPYKRFHTEILLKTQQEPGTTDTSVSFILRGREALGNLLINDSEYLVRVESLDTGERSYIILSNTFNNLMDVVNTIPNNSYVPMTSVGQRRQQQPPAWLNVPKTGQQGKTGNTFTGTKRPGRGTRPIRST